MILIVPEFKIPTSIIIKSSLGFDSPEEISKIKIKLLPYK